jgi:hypothetical protein
MPIDDRELKQAALAGLRHERERMDELIGRLERELGSEAVTATAAEPGPARRRRRLSAAGRADIVAALKKRWAGVKKAKAAAKRKAAGKAGAPKTAGRKAAAPARPAKREAGRKAGAGATRRGKKAAGAKAESKPPVAPAPAAEAPEEPVS